MTSRMSKKHKLPNVVTTFCKFALPTKHYGAHPQHAHHPGGASPRGCIPMHPNHLLFKICSPNKPLWGTSPARPSLRRVHPPEANKEAAN